MSSQPSIAELRAEAKALGSENEEALNFVYKQQEFHRNERAAELAIQAMERVAKEKEAERDVSKVATLPYCCLMLGPH